MPEFTDNLRTTKVLLTKFDGLVLFACAYMIAHVVRLHANVFSRQKLFLMDAIREYFTSFVEQRVLFKFHDEKFFVVSTMQRSQQRTTEKQLCKTLYWNYGYNFQGAF